MKHQIEINVSDVNGKKVNVVKGGEMKLRNIFTNFLLGKQLRMLVLVPSELVESVSIKEMNDKEN